MKASGWEFGRPKVWKPALSLQATGDMLIECYKNGSIPQPRARWRDISIAVALAADYEGYRIDRKILSDAATELSDAGVVLIEFTPGGQRRFTWAGFESESDWKDSIDGCPPGQPNSTEGDDE